MDEDRQAEFRGKLDTFDHLTHLWLVTDSSAAFTRMRAQFPDDLTVGMLYRDYLRNFAVNTRIR